MPEKSASRSRRVKSTLVWQGDMHPAVGRRGHYFLAWEEGGNDKEKVDFGEIEDKEKDKETVEPDKNTVQGASSAYVRKKGQRDCYS